MSEQGIRFFAGVIAKCQEARQELFRLGCQDQSSKMCQQDFRLAQLLLDMEDHVKDRFLKESTRLSMPLEKAAERLSNMLRKGPSKAAVVTVGHNHEDTIFVYLTKLRGVYVPETYEGYKVVVQMRSPLIGRPAYPKGRRR